MIGPSVQWTSTQWLSRSWCRTSFTVNPSGLSRTSSTMRIPGSRASTRTVRWSGVLFTMADLMACGFQPPGRSYRQDAREAHRTSERHGIRSRRRFPNTRSRIAAHYRASANVRPLAPYRRTRAGMDRRIPGQHAARTEGLSLSFSWLVRFHRPGKHRATPGRDPYDTSHQLRKPSPCHAGRRPRTRPARIARRYVCRHNQQTNTQP